MNKKVGIFVAIAFGLLLVCCLGGLFIFRNAVGKIRTTMEADRAFVRTALTETGKNWDEKEFAKYADEAFNKPERREQTRKLFADLKANLGTLVSLGEVQMTPNGTFRTNNTGDARGFYVNLQVPAKFQKQDGRFDVTVRNSNGKITIFDISLNPVKSQEPASSKAANN